MFNMKNTPLFFLEVSLVILPAFVYGIPVLPAPQVDDVHPLLTASLPGKPQDGDLNLLPEELEVVVPKVPINLPVEPIPQAPMTEKLLQLEKELKPSEAVHETPEPLAVFASFLHIDNIQVIIPGKLLEKIFSLKPITLLSVQSEPQDGVVGLPEKFEGILTEELSIVTVDSLPQAGEVENLGKPLSPLAVIASIPQVGNIQLVFSGELLKKLIPALPVEPKPEVVDDTNLTATLEEIVPEKPFLLVPAKESEVVVPTKPLPVVPVESKPQTSGVTVLPGLLEELVTEKPVLLVPVESTPKLEEVVLPTKKPELLDKLPSKVDEPKLNLGDLLKPGVVEQKQVLLAPVESTPKLEEVVLPTKKPELLDKLLSKVDEPKLNLGDLLKPGVVEQKPLLPLPVAQGHDGEVLVPVQLPSDVVNSVSNLLPALPTSKPVLELSTLEKLPIPSK